MLSIILAADGIPLLAVDNLPSEFPREASEHFSTKLLPFIPHLVSLNPELPFSTQTDVIPGAHSSSFSSDSCS
jgi:hypothetical protein